MKKLVSVLLIVTMCLTLLGTSVIATEDVSASAHPEIDFDGPMVFFPFVYTEEPGWAWARELIGDCSALVPGYLYLQDLRTMEITQIIEEPVDLFRSDNETLYCIVDGTLILRTNYWGEDKTVLYSSKYGNLANLKYKEGILLFSDDNHVIRVDVENGQEKDMGIYEGVTEISFAEDGSFTWRNAEGIKMARDEDGHDEMVPEVIGEFAETFEIEEVPAEIAELNMVTPYAISVPVTFPLPQYPVGSYFSETNEACTCHPDNCSIYGGCDCIYYRGGIQCEGFGRYVLDRYANIISPKNASWYSDKDDHWHDDTIKFNGPEEVKRFFQGSPYAKYGTYLRFDHMRSNGKMGTHTAIIAGITSTSVTLYDANYTDSSHPCMVQLITYSFSNFTEDFQAVNRIVAHSFTGTIEQATSKYHTVKCAYDGCEGYIYEEHASTNPGKRATCAYCGYVGEIWNWAPVIAE